ncbi:hypothetical protein EMIT0324P_11207 [Pseudomonas chlororaphis]
MSDGLLVRFLQAVAQQPWDYCNYVYQQAHRFVREGGRGYREDQTSATSALMARTPSRGARSAGIATEW